MAAETIPLQFLASVQSYDKADAFRFKQSGRYHNVSHRDALARVHSLTLGLQSLRLAKGDRVALLSENRLEWALADLAILSAGCINVPVYATLTSDQIKYILQDAETRAVFVSGPEQLAKIEAIRADLPVLEHVVAFETSCAAEDVITLDDLIARGDAASPRTPYQELIATIGKFDWASIIYTSGTTGAPKGVVLTHHNFMSNVGQCLDVLSIGTDDTCLSFLPLSHVFERTAGFYVMMTAGTTIAYAESMETVADNLREVKPSVVCSVPRLYEKMYQRIIDAVESGSETKQRLFRWAVSVGRRYVNDRLAGSVGTGVKGKRALANALVFRKLKARTGGRMRFFVSGGAPLARELNEFFHAAGIPILEGYGLTETSPVLCVNTFENLRFGTVGKPVPGVEISIAQDGEILARGPNIMQGYYKQPEATNEVLQDGWFHTGDIGHLDDDGYLVITDRKKDIIVTAGGKNVAPQPIESQIKQSVYVVEAVLIGDRRRFISCLLVPNFEKLAEFASSHDITYDNNNALVTSARVLELFESELATACAALASYQQPKRFRLLDHELTIENDELTPSLKVKRKVVEEHYAALIESMYQDS